MVQILVYLNKYFEDVTLIYDIRVIIRSIIMVFDECLIFGYDCMLMI